jgi:cation diffusion facilitator CzcD-associated flavoprotein CzcO
MEEYHLVIVGAGRYRIHHFTLAFFRMLTQAGIFGLQVAKTYLEVHPSARLLILDAGQSLGGTWAKERLYDDLYTNNLVGMFEFSDFPMDFETFGVPPGSHIPGSVIHRYLTAYAKHFGVFNKIQCGACVKSVELKGSGEWLILYDLKSGEDVKDVTLNAKKLVLATGTTSEPHMPSIAGSEEFGGQIFHSKELQNHMDEMIVAKNVVVLGGSKSAADAAYVNAARGKHVDWVIRGKTVLKTARQRWSLYHMI